MIKKQTAGSEPARAFGYLGTAFLLVAGAAIIMLLCTVTYKAVAESRDSSDNLRGTLSYLQTQIKSHDAEGCVALRDGMLVLKESDGEKDYELRIYEQDGNLLEEYCAADAEKNPESAEIIAKTEIFSAEYIKKDLLRIETSAGTSYVHLFAAASEKEGAK